MSEFFFRAHQHFLSFFVEQISRNKYRRQHHVCFSVFRLVYNSHPKAKKRSKIFDTLLKFYKICVQVFHFLLISIEHIDGNNFSSRKSENRRIFGIR